MTYHQLLIACGSISVLLIVLLWLYLCFEFAWLEAIMWNDNFLEIDAALSEVQSAFDALSKQLAKELPKPNRRKWRGNKGEV